MISCRLYWTAVALSVAFGALVCLAVANRMLEALERDREAARARVEEERTEYLRRESWLCTLMDEELDAVPDYLRRERVAVN